MAHKFALSSKIIPCTMRTSTSLFLLFFLASLFIHAQSPSAISDIKAVLHQQEKAWNSRDLSAFMEGYWKSDSLVFVGSKGPTYGFLNTLERYKASYPNKEAMGTLNFDLLFIEQWDEKTIQVIGKFTLTRENDQPTGFFTLLFRKIDSVWKIVSDHSSSS